MGFFSKLISASTFGLIDEDQAGQIAAVAGPIIGGAIAGPGGAAVGSAIGGAVAGSAAEKEAAAARERAAQAGISEQERARLSFEERTEPFRQAGLTGAEQLTSFLQDPTQQLEQIKPIVSFLRDQGF